MLSAWNGGNVATFEDFERVEESLEAIQEEVKKDDSLQIIYEQKVKELANLENTIEIPADKRHEPPQKSPKKTEKQEPEKTEEPEKVEEPKEAVSE